MGALFGAFFWWQTKLMKMKGVYVESLDKVATLKLLGRKL